MDDDGGIIPADERYTVNLHILSVRKGEMMPDPDSGFDAGPGGQMTHSFPWTVTPSGKTARVIADHDLTPLELRELASTLWLTADAMDNQTHQTPASSASPGDE